MILFSAARVVDAIEKACDGIWDREHHGFRENSDSASTATRGDVLELMREIVNELKNGEPPEPQLDCNNDATI